MVNVRISEVERLQANGQPPRVDGAQLGFQQVLSGAMPDETVGVDHVGGSVMQGGWRHNRFDAANPLRRFVGSLALRFASLLSSKCLDAAQSNNCGNHTYDQEHRESNPA